MNLAAVLVIGFIESGTFSIDDIFGIALSEPVTLIIGLVVLVLGVTAAVLSEAPKNVSAAHAQHRNKVV